MGLGQILDTAIKLYQANWKTFMGIVAVLVVPFGLIAALVGTTELFGTLVLVAIVEGLVIQPLIEAAMAKAAADVYLDREVEVGATYGYVVPLLGSVLWVIILVALAVFGGVFLLLVGAIFFAVRFYFAVVVVVVEGERGTEALRRSWRLVKGSTWRVLGIIIVVLIISGIVSLILAVPFTILTEATQVLAFAILGDVLASVVVAPFTAIAFILLYFDLRIRKEGYDLEVLAHDLGSGHGSR